jgi:hypothetical protein
MLLEYDPVTNIWRQRSFMNSAKRYYDLVAANNGKVYAIGGDNGYDFPLASVEEYDPLTDAWTIRTSMPTARWALRVVSASNGKIYAIGGQGLTLKTLEEYDPATDTWAVRASMPIGRYGFGAVAASNGKIYTFGGHYNGITLTTVEEYDPSTDTWRTCANMPTARYSPGVATGSNGKIYVIGGYGTIRRISVVEEYDLSTDSWTKMTNMPTSRDQLGVEADSNGMIYAIGGATSDSTWSKAVEAGMIPFQKTIFDNSQWVSTTQYKASYDFSTLVPRDSYTITVRDAIGSDDMKIAPNSNTTFTVDYAGFISDQTPPLQPSVAANGNGTLTTLSATWSSSDPDSPITLYRYAIGTYPGGHDVINWTNTSAISMTRTSLILTQDQAYYVAVQARNEGGLWSESGVSNAVIAGIKTTYQVFLPLVIKN